MSKQAVITIDRKYKAELKMNGKRSPAHWLLLVVYNRDTLSQQMVLVHVKFCKSTNCLAENVTPPNTNLINMNILEFSVYCLVITV